MPNAANPRRLPLASSDELGATWGELRPKTLRRTMIESHEGPPPVEPVIKWTLRFHDEAKRPAMLVVPGATAHDRMSWYRKFLSEEWSSFRPDTVEDIISDGARNWIDESILGNVTTRFSEAKVPGEAKNELPPWFPPTVSWELLWALASIPTFVCEDPLRGLVDESHYVFHEVFRVLWELRFRVIENKDFEPTIQFFEAAVRWLTASPLNTTEQAMLEACGVTRRITSDQERLDVLCFLITLCHDNALLNRYVLCFDGLERALHPENRAQLREMNTFLATLDRWIRLTQTPIGVLIGMDASSTKLAALRRLNPKLADQIVAGLDWTTSLRA